MKTFLKSTLPKIVLASLIGFSVTVHATLSITATATQDRFKTETGQSIPAGIGGWVDGTLTTTGGPLTFTYGRDLGLVPGATGYGNAVFLNEFLLFSNASNPAIDPLHSCFENYSGSPCLNTANDPFTVDIAAGTIPFRFVYHQTAGPGGDHTLTNGGESDNENGAYLVNATLSTVAFAGPSSVAYLGLSDNGYSADDDFQDLALRIAVVPEPDVYAMILAGIGLMGFVMRRRKH